MKSEHLAQLQRWHTDSFGWALHCCRRNRDEAEDVLQDAYLKCVDGRAIFAEQSSIKTWFFGVIRLTAMEYNRKAAQRGRLSFVVNQDEMEPISQPDTTLIQNEEAQIFYEQLNKLSERQYEIMHLVLYQDLTLEEAAPIMDISVGSARTHYHRAKERLREILSESEHG